MAINKIYLSDENIVSDVCIQLRDRKGYVKPLFIKDSIPKIVRAWSYENNIVRLA